MVKRDELISFIEKALGHELFQKARLKDIYANGVQLNGKDEVFKIALGVSMNQDFLNEAISAEAQFCLTHHGIDLTSHNVVGSLLHQDTQDILKTAIKNDITIMGCHYVLDAHQKLGNNAVIIKELGAKLLNIPYQDEWGWIGEFDTPVDAHDLAEKYSDLTNHDVFAVYAGPKMIKRIGVCSGAGKPYDRELWEVIEQKIDAHLTGEIVEPSIALAKGIGFNYFSAGHYATEVFGVQELGKKLKEHYQDKLEVEFIDLPNPL